MDLEIAQHKIAEMINTDMDIYQNYIVYEVLKKNMIITDEDVYRNRYTIDLSHFWYSNHEPEEEYPLTFELRPCVYDKVKTDYYIEYKPVNLNKFISKDTNIVLLPDMTDWGDDTIDLEVRHTYEENGIYHIDSSGFIDTKNYKHTGKNIVSIDNLTQFITDASWLFSECYYAEDTSWFPTMITSEVTDMQYMFYHCPRLRKLDLAGYNTRQVENVNHMFANCINMIKLDLSNFNLSLVKDENVDDMFLNCLNLYELRLDNCDNDTIRKIIHSKNFPTNKITDERVFEEIYNENIINYNIKKKDLLLHKDIIESEGHEYVVNDLFSEYDKESKNLFIGHMGDKERFRKIYCKRRNIAGLIAPENWAFVYLSTADKVEYNPITENLYIPDSIIIELDDNLDIYEECIKHDNNTDNTTII